MLFLLPGLLGGAGQVNLSQQMLNQRHSRLQVGTTILPGPLLAELGIWVIWLILLPGLLGGWAKTSY